MSRIEDKTHEGIRVAMRGRCEKCNEWTRWMVMVFDRWAYWCGCANGENRES
jgi:hypothetical protein